MRHSKPLDALLPRTRQGVLAACLLHPERWWYRAQLAARLGVSPSSLQRELAGLVDAGILERRVEGRQTYYRAEPDFPALPELQGLLVKTAGVADVLRDALDPVRDRIRSAFVFGSLARGEEISASDVDLLVVGEVSTFDLASLLRRAEEILARPVNAKVLRPTELAARSRSRFLKGVLDGPKLFVVGSAAELRAAFAGLRGGAAGEDMRPDIRSSSPLGGATPRLRRSIGKSGGRRYDGA